MTHVTVLPFLTAFSFTAVSCTLLNMSRFPNQRQFAFTIFDDTDFSTVDNTRPVYELLSNLGFHTTKSVWPLAHVTSGYTGNRIGGSTLQDRDYQHFVLELRDKGFEIALHNVGNHDSTREAVCQGLESFRSIVGAYPRCHANHFMNRDNLYWGEQRLNSTMLRMGHRFANLFQKRPTFEGHIPTSPYFWADIGRQHISYVRNFVFRDINLDRINPTLPYHDPGKPLVNFWFSSCEGAAVESYCERISEANQDKLEDEGGVCIMYTHFSQGFVSNQSLHSRFCELMQRLSRMNGWFVPVTTLLDHLRSKHSGNTIPPGELTKMEWRWSVERLHYGTT